MRSTDPGPWRPVTAPPGPGPRDGVCVIGGGQAGAEDGATTPSAGRFEAT